MRCNLIGWSVFVWHGGGVEDGGICIDAVQCLQWGYCLVRWRDIAVDYILHHAVSHWVGLVRCWLSDVLGIAGEV